MERLRCGLLSCAGIGGPLATQLGTGTAQAGVRFYYSFSVCAMRGVRAATGDQEVRLWCSSGEIGRHARLDALFSRQASRPRQSSSATCFPGRLAGLASRRRRTMLSMKIVRYIVIGYILAKRNAVSISERTLCWRSIFPYVSKVSVSMVFMKQTVL